jgi:hypothetical protein
MLSHAGEKAGACCITDRSQRRYRTNGRRSRRKTQRRNPEGAPRCGRSTLQNTPLVSTVPMSVPSLSWQTDRFVYLSTRFEKAFSAPILPPACRLWVENLVAKSEKSGAASPIIPSSGGVTEHTPVKKTPETPSDLSQLHSVCVSRACLGKRSFQNQKKTAM